MAGRKINLPFTSAGLTGFLNNKSYYDTIIIEKSMEEGRNIYA